MHLLTDRRKKDDRLLQINVLAVDDVPLNLLLVEKMLSKFNFRIRKAANGRLALEEIAMEKLVNCVATQLQLLQH